MNRKGLTLSLLAGLLTSAWGAGDFQVNSLFSDHMVLQRNLPVRIYGEGLAGTVVTARLAGREAKTIASEDGWEITLPAMKEGGPYVLEVEGPQKLSFSDVLVGDVWVATGQSNMHMRLQFMPEYKKNASAFGNPQVRLFKVAVTPSEKPQSVAPRDKDFAGGWLVADSASSGTVSAVGYYFCDAMQKALGVPVGLIHSAQGATRVEAWLDEAKLKEVAPIEKPLSLLSNPKSPFVFYNGMIAPLQKFPIKGVIWYQGESSTYDPVQYAPIFIALIRRWREQWGQGDFPFYWVQLHSFQHPGDKSNEAWAWTREAQAQARSEPHTGMVVALDLGEFGDIHPKQKREVGERLARVALQAEGKPVEAVGPQVKSVEFSGGAAVIHFTHAEGGLVAKEVVMNRRPKFAPGADPEAYRAPAGQLLGFQLAGADGKFADAQAVIDGDSVKVQSATIAQPKAVRYGWQDFALANLFNKAGLPAEPFRTDKLPVPDIITKQAEMARKTMDQFKTGSGKPTNAEDPH